MFDKMANVESFNDPSRLALLNQLCKLIFGKELRQLNTFGQGFMRQAGFGIMNSYGDKFGINDAGQNFAVLHQAVARSAGFRPMDQNGNFSSGQISGPGATTLGIARQLNSVVGSMGKTGTNAINTHETAGLSQTTMSQMMGQILRERGGIRSGEYMQAKNVKPGVAGTEEAIQKALEHGADPKSEGIKRAVKAAGGVKAVQRVNEWADNQKELEEQQKEARERVTRIRKKVAKGKASKKDLEQAEKEEEDLTTKVEAAKNINNERNAVKEAAKRVSKLEKMEKEGHKDFKKADLEQAKEDLDRARKKENEVAIDSVRKSKGQFKDIKVAGKEIGDMDFGDLGEADIEAVMTGKIDIGSISAPLSKELKASVKATAKNVKELTDIFGTDNFNELQSMAKKLQMGSLTDSKNIQNVANRIRQAKAVAERSGRTVQEVFEEQAAIAESFKDLNGYEADGNVIEKIQRAREVAQRNAESGATELTAEEQEAKMIDAENIMTRENRDLINVNYLMNKNSDSKDEKTQKTIAEYRELQKKLDAAKTPEEARQIKNQMVQLGVSQFGGQIVRAETTSRAADKDPRSREVINKELERVTLQNDATTFAKNIKYSDNLRAGYEELYGENWEEAAKKNYGEVAATYGNDYTAFERDRKMGEQKRRKLDEALSGKSDAEKEAVYAKERELENLQEKYDNAKTDEEKEELKKQIDTKNEELNNLGGEKYAQARKEQDEQQEKELQAYGETLKKGGIKGEAYERAMNAKRRVLRNSSSTNATRQQELDNIKATSESSKAAGAMESTEQQAMNNLDKLDQFEKEISGKGETLGNQSELKKMLTNVVTGGQEINADTALAAWLDEEDQKKSGLVKYDGDGNIKVDADKINEGEKNITAIKENATDEEKKKYAQNEKIRKMFGAGSEEEMLEILNNKEKMREKMAELSDSGKAMFRKVGEGENATYIGVDSAEQDTMVADQQKRQEKIAEKTKYLKGLKLDDIKVTDEGVEYIEANGKKIEGRAAIEKYITSEAANNPEYMKQLEEQAAGGDKRAAGYVEQVKNLQESKAIDVGEGKTIGEMSDAYNKKSFKWRKTLAPISLLFGDNYDKKQWKDFSDEEKAEFDNSESLYNLKRVMAEGKTSAFREEFADKDNRKRLKEIADKNGIEFDGKNIDSIKAEDMERLAALYGEENKDFKAKYNKYDYLTNAEDLKKSGEIGADGKVRIKDFNGSGEEVVIDTNDTATRDLLNSQSEAMGKEGFQDDAQAAQRNMASALETLSKCVTSDGRIKITHW